VVVEVKKKTSPYFPVLIEHIDKSWLKIKGMHYPFAGKDFKDLKGFSRSFQEWGVMALWDAFMASDSEWVRKSGYSIGAFVKCLPWLVDDPGWKRQAKTYEEKMVQPLTPEIETLFGNWKIAP
jgi:hypothetical protein